VLCTTKCGLSQSYSSITNSSRLQKGASNKFFPLWRQGLGELDVELDYEVAFLCRVVGHGHTFCWHNLLVARFDDVVDGDVECAFVESVDVHGGASESAAQQDVGSMDQVQTFTAETGMGLIFHNENNVGWDVVGPLVSLFGEGDFGARLPALLHCDGQDLVADA